MQIKDSHKVTASAPKSEGIVAWEVLMFALRLLLIAPLVFASPVLAQGTQRSGNAPLSHGGAAGSRMPAATRPSNNPFSNPIGQGVPTATSAGSNHNSNGTNVAR